MTFYLHSVLRNGVASLTAEDTTVCPSAYTQILETIEGNVTEDAGKLI